MIISKPTIFSAIFMLSAVWSAQAQKMTREEYIDRYKHIAVEHMEEYGIPASITLAQGILESGNGNSTLAREANNHFGIKCHTDWKGKRYHHDDDKPQECFRVYKSAEQSYKDHAEFLSNHRQSRYDSLFVYAPTDYVNWARGLKAAGYATAPDYAERLIKIIEENRLYLLDRENGEQMYAAAEDAALGGDVHAAGVASEMADVESNRGSAGAGGLDPNNYRVTVSAHEGYDVYRSNGVSYVVAKAGDSYDNLGRLFRIAPERLRRFNDVGADAALSEGEIVYIQRKRTRWEGTALLHTVTAGSESLYDIAQNYGIRVKNLARMNKVKSDAVFQHGRTVKIR